MSYSDEDTSAETGNALPNYASALGQRILVTIESVGWAKATESVGKSARSLERYVKGEAEPPVSVIAALATCSGFSAGWLATGLGPEKEQEGGNGSDDTVSVRRLDVVASAGPGASGASEKTLEMVPFPRAFLRSIGVSPAHANIVTVAGDSMEPTLSAGDDLIVDTAVKRIRAEALYVLILDGEVVVKRAQRRVNGSILITSDNERYPPEEVTPEAADKLHVAGRVVWFGRSI